MSKINTITFKREGTEKLGHYDSKCCPGSKIQSCSDEDRNQWVVCGCCKQDISTLETTGRLLKFDDKKRTSK